MIFNKTITATECTIDPYLGVESVFSIVQDSITDTFNFMGADNVALKQKYNAMWVFIKHKAIVYSRPSWQEKVIINCRIIKENKLSAILKTEIKSMDNRLLICSYVECCALNITDFKFVLLSTFNLTEEKEDDNPDFDFSNTTYTNSRKIVVSPLLSDMSKHLNNVKALYPVIDTLNTKQLEDIVSSPFVVAVRYLKQAKRDSQLQLNYKFENGIVFNYTDNEDNIVEIGYIKKI